MRITIDLQAAQTEGSFQRGIGRYSESLARSLLAECPRDVDFELCFNQAYPTSYRAVARNLRLSSSRDYSQSIYGYPAIRRGDEPRGVASRTALAEELIRTHWLATKPDVLHISHLGEGFGGLSVVPKSLPIVPHGVVSATLYDLIPLRFPDQYLADASFRKQYLGHLDLLRQCDLLLAISDSSRRDAIELLGLHPDAVRTIWGGVEPHFKVAKVAADRVAALRARYLTGERFVLYTGGDDYRKNLGGAIEAFAEVPNETRRDVRLVIVCSMQPSSKLAYLGTAQRLGLSEKDLVFTGFIPESDLVDLYRLCEVFIFPSLYEGFGLPVVEAMACGAPVIGGDHSSIRELIGRTDALFDVGDKRSIASTLVRVLTDRNFAQDLARYSEERARDFTWSACGRRAAAAFDDALAVRQPVRYAATVTAPKRKLAFFSPLPPCRSGIADHSALLLRYLSKHFEIVVFVDDGYEVIDEALAGAVDIHRHGAFEEMRERFDAVMYEMGNSSYHTYMLPYLARYPGIVTLHDAYLSGLFGYVEFGLGEQGRFLDEMLYAHGTLARGLLAPGVALPDCVNRASIELPCTKRVLDQAIALISHSPFNIDVSRRFYPAGWRAPFHVIRQLVAPSIELDIDSRRRIRDRLGVAPDEILIASFGHVAWTKCGDILLDGFLRSRAGRSKKKARLMFVGALTEDEFGDNLGKRIDSGSFSNRVSITGFLDDRAFADYLAITDVAIQLRRNSRGGTPKGVLDCMAAAVPVIVNAEASYLDYPAHVMRRISPDFDADEVAAAMDELCDGAVVRAALGAAGRAYVNTHHHPVQLARDYAAVINDGIERQRSIALQPRLERLKYIASRSFEANDIAVATEEIARQNLLETVHPRRLLIDVSHLAASDHRTGIPRVVRSIVTALYLSHRADFEPVAVLLNGAGHIEIAAALLQEFGVSSPAFHDRGSVDLREGDTLLMLDSSWARWSEFSEVHRRIREHGGLVITAVYDLIPIRFPEMIVPGGTKWFKDWLRSALGDSDAIVCISRAVADDLTEHITTLGAEQFRGLEIGYWHLGADFKRKIVDPVNVELMRALEKPALLMVGTIEPRKRHAVALDAFESLWRQGCETGLVVLGRPGWLVDDLMARLRSHPQAGRLLHVFCDASDADLEYAYLHSEALLFPSAGEGFGLPLIEAAHRGLPVIANDIPVLREIGGAAFTYVSSDRAETLCAGIAQWMNRRATGHLPDLGEVAYLTWENSASQLLDVIIDNHWHRTI